MKRNCFFQRPPACAIALILMVLAAFASSCKKNNGIASSRTLRQYFSSASQYTLFYKALQRTGLDTLLGGAVPYTVFAVVDSGMMHSGYTSAGIDTIDIQKLRTTLLYQMIQGSITSADLQLYQETPLTTADSGFQAYLQNNNFGLFYNGIPVVGVDSGLSNGIIQGMQIMAAPPVGDLYSTIGTIPSLSDYNFIIQYSGQYGNTTGAYLQTATPSAPITVFLPNNAFFAGMGYDNLAAIQTAGYFFNNNNFWGYGQYYTCDFFGGSELFLSADQFGNKNYLWFTKDGYSFYSDTYMGVNTNTLYRIVQANIVATNGVIHIIQPQ
jgi:uncharacterized surface protein with fasciclin (FAS1) repeats